MKIKTGNIIVGVTMLLGSGKGRISKYSKWNTEMKKKKEEEEDEGKEKKKEIKKLWRTVGHCKKKKIHHIFSAQKAETENKTLKS